MWLRWPRKGGQAGRRHPRDASARVEGGACSSSESAVSPASAMDAVQGPQASVTTNVQHPIPAQSSRDARARGVRPPRAGPPRLGTWRRRREGPSSVSRVPRALALPGGHAPGVVDAPSGARVWQKGGRARVSAGLLQRRRGYLAHGFCRPGGSCGACPTGDCVQQKIRATGESSTACHSRLRAAGSSARPAGPPSTPHAHAQHPRASLTKARPSRPPPETRARCFLFRRQVGPHRAPRRLCAAWLHPRRARPSAR